MVRALHRRRTATADRATLTNVWFWSGIALVLAFFLATRAVETSSAGEAILRGMDR